MVPRRTSGRRGLLQTRRQRRRRRRPTHACVSPRLAGSDSELHTASPRRGRRDGFFPPFCSRFAHVDEILPLPCLTLPMVTILPLLVLLPCLTLPILTILPPCVPPDLSTPRSNAYPSRLPSFFFPYLLPSCLTCRVYLPPPPPTPSLSFSCLTTLCVPQLHDTCQTCDPM